MEASYIDLRDGWMNGDRDRERALHLLYLAWMHWAEPQLLTGLTDNPTARDLWLEIYEHFGGEISTDAEFLHVAGLMASLFPWGLGDENKWAATAERLQARSLELQPDGFPAVMFEGRGDYGEYFAHHARRIDAPEVFTSSLGKTSALAAMSILFFALITIVILSKETNWTLRAGWVFLGISSLANVVMLVRPYHLKIDDEGFTVSGGMGLANRTIAWRDVGEFYVRRISLGASFVGYTYADRKKAPLKGLLGRSWQIPGYWPGGPWEMLRRLNEYRQGIR